MHKKVQSALISVFYKDGLEPLVKELHAQGVTIYSTGGTQAFIEKLEIPVVPVENLTTYPSILGGRVKTLHPTVFGGILGRRSNATDVEEMKEYKIPELDLVIVDLYPFEETVAQTKSAGFKGTPAEAEQTIIEKIDIGGPSMIRAAAKNHKDVVVIAAKSDYAVLEQMLKAQNGETSLEQRRQFAAKAFDIVGRYDIAIYNYFHPGMEWDTPGQTAVKTLRYGENPHQQATFHGDWTEVFEQLHGKEISYNNLVDIDSAIQLIREFTDTTFAVIKHTNVCGIASRNTIAEAWKDALAGDPESAFGGVLVANGEIDEATANMISELFFEVLIAPSFSEAALTILKGKKNRILLQLKNAAAMAPAISKSVINGKLVQDNDEGNYSKWEEVGGHESSADQKADLIFANLVCKHLKSNAIALVKNKQLIGKGCGQTSRIDALRHAIEKAGQFEFDLQGAVLASDAFFPFNDCVKMGHEEGIVAFVQPGGSVRDKDSIDYCKENDLVMVMTGIRHFKH